VADLTKWLLAGALLASLGTSATLWHTQQTQLDAIQRELKSLPDKLDSERALPPRQGMGWSREDQDLASEIARQVRAALPAPANGNAPAMVASVALATPPAPRAELPPGATDVGDTPPTADEQAAYDAAQTLVDDALARGELTEQAAAGITALRRRNGNRPEFFALRERLVVAFNHQQLKVADDGSAHAELP
jgi:hypothetical protein